MSREVVWGMSNEICTSHPQLSTMTLWGVKNMFWTPQNPLFLSLVVNLAIN